MQRMETVKQSGLWSNLGYHGYNVFNLLVWLCISGGQTRHNKILIFKSKFGLEGQGQSLPQNNRDLNMLNQRVVHTYALV